MNSVTRAISVIPGKRGARSPDVLGPAAAPTGAWLGRMIAMGSSYEPTSATARYGSHNGAG
jgi:hypothetical protein